MLEIVQEILNDMDSDEVNSISDTLEASQAAEIVKSTYFAMLSNRNWPHTNKPIKMVASAQADRPTHMSLPEGVKELVSLNYNKVKNGETRKRYGKVTYLDTDAFLRRQNQYNSDKDNIDIIMDETGVELLIRNDKAPEYFTSFDDTVLVFDSYDSSVDSTLQNSKIQASAYIFPAWNHVDDFIPDLPAEAFSAFIEEAKAKCSFKLRQVVDQKAEMEARKQQTWLSRKARRIAGGIKYPDYGRKSRGKVRDVTFRGDR